MTSSGTGQREEAADHSCPGEPDFSGDRSSATPPHTTVAAKTADTALSTIEATRHVNAQLLSSMAVEATNDGIWDWDLDSPSVYTSARCNEIVGLATGDPPLSPRRWWDLTHPDDRPALVRALEAHIASTVPQINIEQRVLHVDGTWRWVRLRGALVRDAAGSPRRLTGALTDITEHRRADAVTRRQQEELAHVGRMNAMAELAAGLAHELSQPLAAITNYAKGTMLRIQAGKADAAQIIDGLERIAAQALRAGEIIRRLRNLIRRGDTRAEPIQVNELVRETIALLDAESLRGCRVRVDVSQDLPAISADPVQLQQVLVNLVRNAVEAMPTEDAEREVVIHTSSHGSDFVEIAVSDSGAGMPPEEHEKIFEPFFSTKPKGLGVGLSISRSIAEAHGGRLWATANDLRGTTFHLRLPIRQSEQL